MGDDEFRVPPANRREARRFEPPPWEADAFKELELKRAVEDAQDDPEIEAAVAAAVGPEPEEAQAGPAVREAAENEPAAQVTRPAPGVSPAGEAVRKGELDEEHFASLMARLRDEEPSAANYWIAWAVVGFLMIVLGAVIMVWAMAAFMKPDAGQVGTTGGSILLLFGAGFIGGGAWFIYRGLKKRGVL